MIRKGRAEAEAFALDVFRRHRGVIDAVRKNAVRVTFPEVPPFAASRELVVAFERKAMDHFPDAALAIPGSPFYLKLLDWARGRGCWANVYTPVVEPLPPLPDGRLVRAPESLSWKADAVANHPHVVFNFAISYHSVVTSDDLVSIGYDVVGGRFRDPAVIEALHSVWSETLPASPGDWEATPAPDPQTLLPMVLEELDRRTRRKVARARRNTEQLLEQEIHNVEEYYRQLVAEERAMLARLSRTSPKEAQEREKRIRRYQLDWKRRIAEETRHHQCRVHIRLVSVSLVYTPRSRLVVSNGSESPPVATCYFNHFLGTLDGAVCHRTGTEIGPWTLESTGQWFSRANLQQTDSEEGDGDSAGEQVSAAHDVEVEDGEDEDGES